MGGVGAPWLFGVLIGTGSRQNVTYGYAVASALMIAAAIMRRYTESRQKGRRWSKWRRHFRVKHGTEGETRCRARVAVSSMQPGKPGCMPAAPAAIRMPHPGTIE